MIERAEVTAIVHATEDIEKVGEAIANLLGIEDLGEIEVTEVRGHHGNPILYLKLVLKGKKAREAVKNIMKAMDEFEYDLFRREVPSRSEGSKLYLRFDKQRAYLGEVRLSSGSDVVRVLIVFKGKVNAEELERLREEG